MNYSDVAGVIAQIESSNNQWAMRFEPAYTPKPNWVIAAQSHWKNFSYDTCKILCATSFGLYQIMSDELIALGLTQYPGEYLASVALQNSYFRSYLTSKKLNTITLADLQTSQQARIDFGTVYNGNGPVYADSIARVLGVNR